MKEIKFRAIRTGRIHFFHGESLLNDSLYQGEIGLSDNHQGTFEMCKKETLGQFTGLADKNGVEIYEGDIVKVDNNIICFCEFLYGSFMLNQGDIRLNLQFYNKSQIEVIGNIHQNPKLLK